MPFVSSCDSTRANMSAKQFSQSLTHKNCEVAYVISNEWHNLVETSGLGIQLAQEDGEVIYNKNDLFISHYPNSNRIDIDHLEPIKKIYSIFGSTLRNSLEQGTKFSKDDVLYEYDCFKNGIPTSGYNVMTAYMPFFGFNHEDSLVISESLAERARHSFVETIYIPIYEYSLFQKVHNNKFGYFPDINETLDGDVICTSLLPQNVKHNRAFKSVKKEVIQSLENLSLSDLINMKVRGQTSGFSCEKVKTKIEYGTVTGFKVHRLKKNVKLINKDLQDVIKQMRNCYDLYILDLHNDLTKLVNSKFATKIIKQHYLFTDRDKIRKGLLLGDAVYLLEFEISCDHGVTIGDKMSNLCVLIQNINH